MLTVTAASAPAGQGSASVVGNQVQFNPGTDFDYLDTGETANVVVSYTITDEFGATSSSTVTITVNGANDAPVANDDTASTTEDAAVSGNVLANDTDVDVEPLTVTNPGTYVGAYGTLDPRRRRQLHLHAQRGAPRGSTTARSASDVFSYTASDGTASDTATLTVTVNGANDAPVANDDTASTNEDSAGVSGNVLTNDTDVDVEPLTVASPGHLCRHLRHSDDRRRRQLHLHARRGRAGARYRRDGAGRLHLHRDRRHRLRYGDSHRHGQPGSTTPRWPMTTPTPPTRTAPSPATCSPTTPTSTSRP